MTTTEKEMEMSKTKHFSSYTHQTILMVYAYFKPLPSEDLCVRFVSTLFFVAFSLNVEHKPKWNGSWSERDKNGNAEILEQQHTHAHTLEMPIQAKDAAIWNKIFILHIFLLLNRFILFFKNISKCCCRLRTKRSLYTLATIANKWNIFKSALNFVQHTGKLRYV